MNKKVLTSRLLPLHNLYLLFRQPVQLVHQLINLFVARVDLALEGGLLMLGLSIILAHTANRNVLPKVLFKVSA